MLTAYTQDKQLFRLNHSMNREQLKRLRTNRKFSCPACSQPLVLKVGAVRHPHFAHRVDTSCRSSFSEGESYWHLLGKSQLADFFLDQKCEVLVEKYIPAIQQRPDVFLIKEDRTYAIEFQCSSLSAEKMRERTRGYEQVGIRPIWLYCVPKKWLSYAVGVQQIRLNHFQQQFITSQQCVMYSPQTQAFYYFTHLLHTNSRQFIGTWRPLLKKNQTFPWRNTTELSEQQKNRYVALFQTDRRNHLRNRVRYTKKGIQDDFLRHCYEMRWLPVELPEWVGIPILGSEQLPTALLEWQTALWHYAFEQGCELIDAALQLATTQVEKQLYPTYAQIAEKIRCGEQNVQEWILSLTNMSNRG